MPESWSWGEDGAALFNEHDERFAEIALPRRGGWSERPIDERRAERIRRAKLASSAPVLLGLVADLLSRSGHHENCPAAYVQHAPCSPLCGEARRIVDYLRRSP